MDARLLTRLTNAGLVAVVGMGAGHLLLPARADASPMVRGSFVALLAGAGAVAGLRERNALADERGSTAPRTNLWMPAGAVSALVLGAIAWYVVHG